MGLFPPGGASPAQESVLVALLVGVGALFAVTVVISGLAIVVRGQHRARERLWEALERRWQQPVLRAVADEGAIGDVHQMVAPGEARHFVGFVLEYARRVRGEERGSLRDLVRPFLDEISELAESRRTEVRARAVQTLGTLGLPDHEDRVVAALDDASPLVAMVAARALARGDTPQYAGAILARLTRFKGWNRRFLAAMLAAMGPPVSPALRAGLEDEDAEPWTRAVQAEALRLQSDFLAGDVAARIVGRETDRELLASSLRLLGEIGRPEHAPAVRAHAGSGDAVIRAQALRALGSLGGEPDIPLLLGAMDDPSPWAALYAARGAWAAGGRGALTEVAASDDPTAQLARQVLTEGGLA